MSKHADPILVELYCEETKLSPYVINALLLADIEPRHRDRIDEAGYRPAERRALDAVSSAPEAVMV